jgi:hypothetical protein
VHHLVETFRKVADARGGPVIGFYLVWIFLLCRQELCKTCQAISDLGVAQNR